MFRYFLAILLIISTCAVVAHVVLAYHFNAVQSLVDEKESSDDKSGGKDVKDYKNEKIVSFNNLYPLSIKGVYKSALNKFLRCSKGFYDKPYNPPNIL
jgi:hypothetical protein